MAGLEAFKHDVAFNTLHVRHIVEASPNTISVVREVRFCVIAICISWAAVEIVRSWMAHRKGRT